MNQPTPQNPNPPAEQPKPEGFGGKAWFAVKEFFKGAVDALPRSALFSGIAFGASALMGSMFGFNPLMVQTFDSTLALRLLASIGISSSISGVINSVQEVRKLSDEPKPQAATTAKAPRVPQREPEVNFDMTPSPMRVPAGVVKNSGRMSGNNTIGH
jgi:hypothetical protein